jgi:hypothetical protein
VSKPVLEQARQIIEDGILVRKGMIITPEVARERAANIAMGLMELLCDPNDSRASIVSGEIRSRYYFDDRPAPTDDDERIKP